MRNTSKLVEKTRSHLRSRAAFQDSVDEANLVHIDYQANPWWRSRYSCWEVKGKVAEDYKDVALQIHKELEQSCRESSWEVFVWPYMVGKSIKNAKPVIVVASEDERSREEAKAAIERSGILKEHPYFKLWPLRYLPTGPVNPVAMEACALAQRLPPAVSFDVYFDPTEHLRLVGMPVYIKHSETSVRRATANAVCNGVDYGYITAAHAFTKAFPRDTPSRDTEDRFEFPFDSDSENESAEDVEMDVLSHYSGTSPGATVSERSSFTSSQTSDTLSQSPQCVGNSLSDTAEQLVNLSRFSEDIDVPTDLDTSSVELAPVAGLKLLGKVLATFMSRDCVIVSVTNAAVISFLSRTKQPGTDVDNTIKVSEARRTAVVACTSHGLIHGSLLDLPLYMRLANSNSYQLVYKFTYDGDIKMGDCGTLVIDTKSGELYGHVIADSRHRRVAFIMAAKPLMTEIKENGNWRLNTVSFSSEEKHIGRIGASDQHMHTRSPSDLDVPSRSIVEPRQIMFQVNMPLTSIYSATGRTGYGIQPDRGDDNTPPFNAQENYCHITSEGIEVIPTLEAKIKKGFFLSSDNVWTCYRRNYFSVNVSYRLTQCKPNARLYLDKGDSESLQQIQSIAVSLSAAVDGSVGKSIELVQHTPKLKRGPALQMKKELLAPTPPEMSHDPSSYNLNNFNPIHQRLGPQLPLQNGPKQLQQYSPNSHSSNYQHAFERIQFKCATANNGKRRAQQQYYHLIVELWADLQNPQDSGPRWVKVAAKISHPIVVRGRSPSHYQNEGPHSVNTSQRTKRGDMGRLGYHGLGFREVAPYFDYSNGLSGGGTSSKMFEKHDDQQYPPTKFQAPGLPLPERSV